MEICVPVASSFSARRSLKERLWDKDQGQEASMSVHAKAQEWLPTRALVLATTMPDMPQGYGPLARLTLAEQVNQ
jgi:hypothetical protein